MIQTCVLVRLAASIAVFSSLSQGQAKEGPRLLFVGQAATVFTSSSGTRIVSDPYNEDNVPDWLGPFPAGVEARAITISHFHPDHSKREAVSGKPEVVTQPGIHQVDDIKLTAFGGYEGSPKGVPTACGNRAFVFEVDGVKLVHLGDSGIVTNPETLKAIENADIVVVSIDDYVIPHSQVMTFMAEIKARTVVPAHWQGPIQLATFLKTVPASIPVVRAGSTVELVPGMPTQVLVLTPAALKKE